MKKFIVILTVLIFIAISINIYFANKATLVIKDLNGELDEIRKGIYLSQAELVDDIKLQSISIDKIKNLLDSLKYDVKLVSEIEFAFEDSITASAKTDTIYIEDQSRYKVRFGKSYSWGRIWGHTLTNPAEFTLQTIFDSVSVSVLLTETKTGTWKTFVQSDEIPVIGVRTRVKKYSKPWYKKLNFYLGAEVRSNTNFVDYDFGLYPGIGYESNNILFGFTTEGYSLIYLKKF
jgi:hypothetical protein